MVNKKLILLIALSALLMLIPSVYANTVIAFNGTYTGSTLEGTAVNFSGTFTAGGGTVGATQVSGNVTVYAYPSGTRTKICTGTTGVTDAVWSCSGSVNGLTEAASMTFGAVHNETGAQNDSAAANITINIDRTAPTAAITVLTLQAKKSGTFYVDASGSSDNVNASPRYVINLTRADGSTTSNQIFYVSGSARFTFPGTDLTGTGLYTAQVGIFDTVRASMSSTNANVARQATTTQTFQVSSDRTGEIAVITAPSTKLITNNRRLIAAGVIGGIVIIVGIFTGALAFGSKGKRRKR